MNMIDILRIMMIFTGVLLFILILNSLARRKMIESFCLTWGVIAIILILAGILLKPYGISAFISATGLVLIIVTAYCVIFGIFYITTKVSELARRNQELSIQITLLNQENRMIMKKLEELTEEAEVE